MHLQKPFKQTVQIVNIIILLFLICHFFVIIFIDNNKENIYTYFEIIWTVILFISTIIFTICGIIMVRINYYC